MGMVFRLMVFLLMFNLATGMCFLIFGYNIGNNLDPNTGINQVNQLNTTFGTTTGVPIADNSFWYRFLDFVSLGFYNKIKVFLNNTIFSIPAVLESTGLIDSSLTLYFNGFIMIVFILGMFELITGKDLFGR